MAEATDAQMQRYGDERIRPRAEQVTRVLNALEDDNATVADIFQRANGSNPWNDARTDGPPVLLASQAVLQYNTFMVLFQKALAGTITLAEVSDLHATWLVVRTFVVNAPQV